MSVFIMIKKEVSGKIMSEWDYMFKIGFFAGKNVGKKSLSKRFSNFEDYYMGGTTGVHFLSKTMEIYNKIIKLHYWLFATGNERFNDKRLHSGITLWKQYFKGANGVIIMYDITNRKSLNDLSEWCQLAKHEGIQILLVGNKLDLEENREVSKEEVEKLKKQYEISSSMEISLKTGENVFNMSKKIAEMLYERFS